MGELLTGSCGAWPRISALTSRTNRPPGPQAPRTGAHPQKASLTHFASRHLRLEWSGSQPLPQLYHSEAETSADTQPERAPLSHPATLGLGPAEDREGLGGEVQWLQDGPGRAWAAPQCHPKCPMWPRNPLQLPPGHVTSSRCPRSTSSLPGSSRAPCPPWSQTSLQRLRVVFLVEDGA